MEDESAHCCVIKIPLVILLEHAFPSNNSNHTNMDTIMRWRLQNLCTLESQWFEFTDIILEKDIENYNEGVQSLLMQFESIQLMNTGYQTQSVNPQTTATSTDLKDSKVHCFGKTLRSGDFMKHTKMYYPFQHFGNKEHQIAHGAQQVYTFRVHRDYFDRLQLPYFKCSQIQHIDIISKIIKYEESILYELWEIRRYLDRYWGVQSVCTRISVVVRIVGKSMEFEDTVYLTDNSLLISEDGIQNVHTLPLVIDNVDKFSMACDMEGNLYEQQPLVLLRDIALHFDHSSTTKKGHLELRFDEYSMIERVTDFELKTEKRMFSYPNKMRGNMKKEMLKVEEFEKTPWTASVSAMVTMEGEVGMVAMTDGFDPRCLECRRVSQRYFGMAQTIKDVEAMACLQCLRERGEIRMVVEREGVMEVVIVPVTNVWCTESKGIKRAIQGKVDNLYIEEVLSLKQRLKQLVGDGNSNDWKSKCGLKQCVIEYARSGNRKSRGAVDCVECFHCFHCVL